MNENTMNESDFQFFKDKFKSDVKEYLEIDDQIKAINKALKLRRDKKKLLSESILENMNKFQINFMNIKNGKLTYSESKRKEPLNKKNLITGLNNYFDNEVESKRVSKLVLDSRKDVVKVTLRRTINKTNNIMDINN